jgi:hypothetical protein
MDWNTAYYQYLRDPSEKTERNLLEYLEGSQPLNMPSQDSFVLIEAFPIFKAIVDKFSNTIHQDRIILELIKYPHKTDHIAYLLDLTPSLRNKVILVTGLEDARQRALSILSETKECICYFNEPILVEDAVPYGFFPYNLEFTIRVLEHPEAPLETLRYHYSTERIDDITQAFMMATEAQCRIIQKRHKSTVLFRLFYPYLLYSSLREKTDMGMFRTPFSNIGTRNDTLEVNGLVYRPISFFLFKKG